MAKYQIFADEAWTHGTPPPNRYHCFFGGILGLESEVDRLQTALTKIKLSNGITQEVKWSNVSPRNVKYYKELIDCLKYHLLNHDVKYRQMFRDRAFHHDPDPDDTELDIQFKIYYQYIKHIFGCKHIPVDPSGTTILIRLDGHSSEKHKNKLREFLEDLPRVWKRADITVTVTYENSENSIRLQVCDLVMGAAGYYGNKFHLRRPSGKRGMTSKQKIKLDMAKYIYNTIKDIDAKTRGSKAFNWFESTGMGGDPENSFNHKLRIWKFIPEQHRINKGWQNDNLDKQGMFIRDNFED
ncbi:DUF3800 domain-containing protein [Pectobacterium brasiliense]|uniref:DUF3800 domain-containing protein n=1 Tax=Pectobacterium brasiliense TaxID=180957 RepID=UPI00057C37E5|nr:MULTISPECIES: DUF3800 domain-containing protein [Pectobacterium]ARA78335.1 hypothetical protein B5S52_21670 [Pectobacterium brasiliense]KHS98322.1 hypothetical protein RC90_09795 [Pectobacterium brasiliense]KHT15370.1 hypothetical protein RC97_17765 [Pectobacterium brasiliense]MBN3230199.1 DUF3800 domain-containing protein [Pectobacterium brasiliense]OYN55096.1 hypothetical protein B7L52_12590 [Pectobacterium carotovorum]